MLALLAVVVLLALVAVAAWAWPRLQHERGSQDARTRYAGYVQISLVDLVKLEARLEARGCRPMGGNVGGCLYERIAAGQGRPPGIAIHPRGRVFGPSGIFVTADRLYADRDLPGPPDEEAYRQDVRREVQALGGIVQIVEGSWKLTEVLHPWTVVY
jgi:hypothetical protein